MLHHGPQGRSLSLPVERHTHRYPLSVPFNREAHPVPRAGAAASAMRTKQASERSLTLMYGYHLALATISPLNLTPLGGAGGWWSPAVRAFGGGSPVREVGTSSCWAPPPSRQPQRGSAAPYHGRLGATTRWGDKVRVEGHANGNGGLGCLSSSAPLSPLRRTGGAGREGT